MLITNITVTADGFKIFSFLNIYQFDLAPRDRGVQRMADNKMTVRVL